MASRDLIDLVVLAIAAKAPTTISRMALAARAMTPGTWTPTLDVVEAAVDRNLAAGHLRPIDRERFDARLQLTVSGRKRLNALLLAPPDPPHGTCASALAIMRLCCLDLVDGETIHAVLAGITRSVAEEIRNLEDRVSLCPHVGRFTGAWFDLERQRLRAMARLIGEMGQAQSSHECERSLEGEAVR